MLSASTTASKADCIAFTFESVSTDSLALRMRSLSFSRRISAGVFRGG
jgi:hypothetical protein